MASSRVLCLAVLCMVVSTSNGCSCSPDHPQQDFCDSHFVVKLNVIEVDEIILEGEIHPRQVQYTVNISTVYKSTDIFESANKAILLVPGTSAQCRKDLEVGVEYVVMGRVFGNEDESEFFMHTSMCDYIKRFADVTGHQITYLTETYQQHCDCQVVKCHPLARYCHESIMDTQCLLIDPKWMLRNEEQLSPSDRRLARLERRMQRCNIFYSYCKMSNNKCQWNSVPGFHIKRGCIPLVQVS